MIKILIKGEAGVDYDGELIDLDGIDCQDCFSDYFDGKLEKISASKGLRGGYTEFKYYSDKLWTHTTYESDEVLTDEELTLLAKDTQGQWSDGIGEGFEQEPCFYGNGEEEAYISMWCRGQELIIEQNEYTI